jgi:hypothetical protein
LGYQLTYFKEENMTLQAELKQFIGTENYYRHSLVRKLLYTDGVQYFAEKAGAYWLIDIIGIIAIEMYRFKQDFCLIHVVSKDNEAKIAAQTDSGVPNFYEKTIDYTDLPEGDYQFYLQEGSIDGINTNYILMLPSEY